MENTIMLAACRENEDLPQNPELPADLFTACLTTPIRMALRWHWLRHQETFPGFLDETLLDRIPGAHSNRMSLLGEINWIFTAVTDTIAWCSFPIDVFQKLFRQDLLVAGLFRNYLLAERIMKTYGCTPVSAPALPPTFRHSMWDAWDHALDRLVHYLPRMLKLMEGSPVMEPKLPIILPKSSNQLNPHGGIPSQTVSSQLVSPLPVMATDQAVEIAVCQQIPQLGRATTTTATAAAVVAATAAAAVNCGQPHTRVTSTSRSDVRIGAVPANGAPGNLIQQQHRTLVSSRQPTSTNQPNTNWPLKHTVLPQVPARPDFQSNKKVVNFTDLPPPGFRKQRESNLAQSKLVPSEAGTKSPPNRPVPRYVDALDQLLQEDGTEKRIPSAGGADHPNTHASSSLPPSPTSLTRHAKKQPSNQHVSFVEETDIRTTNLPPVGNAILEATTNTGTTDRSLSGAPRHDKSELVADRPIQQTEQPVNTPAITKQQQHSSGADGSEGEVDDDEDDEDEETDDELDDSEDEEEEEEAEEDTADIKAQIPRSKAHPEDGHKSGSDSGHKTRHHRERIMDSNISSDKHSRQRVSCPDLNVTHLPEPSKPLVTVTQIDAVSTDVPVPTTTMVAPVVDSTEIVHSSHPPVPKGTSNATTLDQQVVTNTSAITTTSAQIDTHAPSEHTLAALRRQRPVIHKLYTFQSRTEQPQQLRATIVAPVTGNEPVKPNVLRSGIHGAYPNRPNFYVPPTGLQAVRTNPPIGPSLPSTGMGPNHDIRTTSAPQTTIVGQPTTQVSEPPVYAGSVIGGSGLASFFTSQMSAFKVWLQTTDEKRPPAMQLPILLQILLSQSHRTRAMQLLSEFLDLGPWAVTHCLMVGILPYIVRLFSSNLFEVKPHLVFIWGKIIASAQTEFSRNDSVRDVGYKYFLNCLSDTENLSLLTRTITAFALTKMLEKEPNGEPDSFFQEVSLKQNFIPLVLSQLADNPPDLEQETLVRLRLWLIFALSKLWRKNDEARWFGIRYNVTEVLYAYLDDICPEVRAATVCALGTLVDNQTLDASKQDHASQIGLQVCTHLVKLATLEASPLVRRELIAALCGLVRQFDTQLCAVAFCYLLELQQALQNPPTQPPSRTPASRPSRHSVTGGTSNRPIPDCWSSVNRSAHNRENGLVESHLLRTPTTTSSAVLSPKFLKRPDYFNPAHTVFASTTNIYFQFWMALVHLSNDPYPDVAKAARVVVRYLLDKFDIPAIASSSSSSNETATELNACQASSPQPTKSASIATFSSPTDPPPTSTAFRTPDVVVPNTPLARAVRPQMASPPRASIQLIPGSGPAPTQTSGSPRGSQAQVMYQSFSSCSPMNTCNYLTQRRPARPGVALTSTFLIHSAQFPGRRHQQADQVIRKPLLDAQTVPPPLVRTPVVSGDNNGSDTSQSVLNEVQRTQFFAWSCRWFTRPLLVKYGGTSMKETRSPVTYSSNTNSNTPADTIFQKSSFSFGLSDKSPHSSHRSTSPDPELAALCAVSVDSDAVAYADRLSRLTNLRHTLRSGRLRWLEALSGNHVRTQARSSADLLPTDDIAQARLMSQLACHQLDNEPGPIRVHPYHPHLVVGDRSGVSVQSSKTLESLNRLPTTPDVDLFSSFSDQSQPVPYSQGGSSRVTDLHFINCCEERCLLLCAHEDGRVRVWRNYLRDLGQDPEIVTAWTGLSELIPSSQPAGLVAHWSQSTSQLALGGDSRLIRLWDCEREARLRDVPTGADACVTGLDRTADQRLLCAGFGDGGVRVFDLRAPASSTTASAQHGDCHIFSGQADTGWIHAVQFGVGGRLYATGSTGTVSTWQWTDTSSGSTQQPSRVSRRTTLATTKLTSRTSTTGLSASITAATATGGGARFERRLYPARIAIPANAPVHCAALKVDLPSTSSHFLVAGVGGPTCQLLLHRIQDGTVHSIFRPVCSGGRESPGIPVSLAVHPAEPLIVAGLKDKSLLLISIEASRGSRA
ncbi:hypothetical protein P879_03865 [Paragonimus westermani]|uniref:Regulatory associated protein of mTOR n=1 Tax=Paragonimus westermani TaxID=34504 RepID=A0A8T0D084_9TREM|nr:hypothetical protein P879_03865 [Paragonimus westermani]